MTVEKINMSQNYKKLNKLNFNVILGILIVEEKPIEWKENLYLEMHVDRKFTWKRDIKEISRRASAQIS